MVPNSDFGSGHCGGLTNLPLDKMAAFLQIIFSDAFLWMKSLYFDKKNSLKFIPKGPLIDNNQHWFR